MKLYDFITKLNYEAALLPNMGRICGGDIYELNHYQNVKYPAFCATQLQHSEAGDWRYYQFNLFYVDRLTSTHGNAQQIQSEAIDALSTIIRNITSYGIELQGSVLYDTFTERFDSECAGAYATVTFAAMADDICPQWYRDPVRKIYYTLGVLDSADERFLRDSDILIDGDAGFLFNQFDQKTGSGVIWVILEKPDGYMNFNLAREQIAIKTIDFSDIDIEFRFGENGLGINYSHTLEEIIFPEKLTYLGLLQQAVFSSVTLPDTVTYIGHTFLYCYDLVNVVYGGTMEQWNAIPKFNNVHGYPYNSMNWHGGETAPMFCEVICSDGVVALCKPDCECNPCPVDSPCKDYCGDCESDAPCGDCALDGVCTSDGSDCPTDGVCTEDNPCPTDGVCTEDAPCVDCAEDICSSDTVPITGNTFGSDLSGLYRMEKQVSVPVFDENAYYVIADEDMQVHAIGLEENGEYRPIPTGYTLNNDGYITDIENWSVFTLKTTRKTDPSNYTFSDTVTIKEKMTDGYLAAGENSEKSPVNYSVTPSQNQHIELQVQTAYGNIVTYGHQMDMLVNSDEFYASNRHIGHGNAYLYKLIPVE